MLKRKALSAFGFFVMVLFSVQIASVQIAAAVDPEWQKKQEILFKEAGIKPGDIISTENWEKCEGLLPDSMVNWVKTGKMELRIGRLNFDIDFDDGWYEATKKNFGKFKLDKEENLLLSNGEFAEHVYGYPFPDVYDKMETDPDSGVKFMYNRQVVSRRLGNGYEQDWTIEWVGKDGLERSAQSIWHEYNYWGRQKPIPNPDKMRWRSIVSVARPYDMSGMCILTLRKLKGTEDELYVYVPAIRRVRRMSGANRCDPYLGSDMTVDDGNLWAGLTNSMKWRFIEERIGLIPMEETCADHAQKMTQLSDGTWRSPANQPAVKMCCEQKDCKVAPWSTSWAEGNMVWVPRRMFVVEALPLDPYYNYAKSIYWIDKQTHWISHKICWDKSGEYWKSSYCGPVCWEWGDGLKGVETPNIQVFVDEKTKHATYNVASGVRQGVQLFTYFNRPFSPTHFTVERLRMWSK